VDGRRDFSFDRHFGSNSDILEESGKIAETFRAKVGNQSMVSTAFCGARKLLLEPGRIMPGIMHWNPWALVFNPHCRP
jgi:hypothetical protein